MIIKTMMVLKTTFYRAVILSLALLAGTGFAQAFTSLDDSEMSDVTGDGMSFVWTDFRMMFNPESYLEQMGSPSNNTCSSTGANAGNYNCLRRADLRWFGANVSSSSDLLRPYDPSQGGSVGAGATPGTSDWATSWTTTGANMTQCRDSGIQGLGCPRGGGIKYFAAPDNPYILRVNTYDGGGAAAGVIGNGVVTYQGVTGTDDWDPNNALKGSRQTVLEFLAPASEKVYDPARLRRFAYHYEAQDPYRFSFWGEIESGRGAPGGGLLKSQTIISGNAAGSAMRYYKFTQTTTSPGANLYNTESGCVSNISGCTGSATNPYLNRTLAIAYDSWLRGDLRFSVAQDSSGVMSDAIGVPVNFDPKEGMYFRNAEVHLPLGQLFYQALTINMPRNISNNTPTKDGNFTLEVPIIPNHAAVYTRFYSLNTPSKVTTTGCTTGTGCSVPNAWDYGYATARAAYLDLLPVRGGATPAFMPAKTVATINGYGAPDINYSKTHGFAHWGDWSICQGVGCALPMGANTAAQAFEGTGRNSWDSSGDGVFFIGKTDFNAYAYRVTASDVRANTNEHTKIEWYQNYAACTPGNATAYTACGSGGAYGQPKVSGGGTTKNVSNNPIHTYNGTQDSTVTTAQDFPAENYFLNTSAQGLTTIGSGPNAGVSRNTIYVPAGTALNLGDGHLEGVQINLFKFTSRGALN